jgi:hypothetical protein
VSQSVHRDLPDSAASGCMMWPLPPSHSVTWHTPRVISDTIVIGRDGSTAVSHAPWEGRHVMVQAQRDPSEALPRRSSWPVVGWRAPFLRSAPGSLWLATSWDAPRRGVLERLSGGRKETRLGVRRKRPAERGVRRAETNTVAAYLTALRAPKVPARSRDALRKRRAQLEQWITEETLPIREVELIQQRLDIDAQLAQIDQTARLRELEDEFVNVAASWAKRSGISAAALREVGVPASVLRRAGLL